MKLVTARIGKKPASISLASAGRRSRRIVVCTGCGCSEHNACDGGCSWANAAPPVCSRCASPGGPFEVQFLAPGNVFVIGPGPEKKMGGRALEFNCGDYGKARDLARALNKAWLAGLKLGKILGHFDLHPTQSTSTHSTPTRNGRGKPRRKH